MSAGSDYSVGVGILAYERPEYLRVALKALLAQCDAKPFPLVIMDNGSREPLEAKVADLLSLFPGPVSIIREPVNALSPLRYADLIDQVNADFVLLPGDDDVAAENYVHIAQTLVAASSDVTIISSGMDQIDAQGRFLATKNPAPEFSDQPTAIGQLFIKANYCMPVTGVRKAVLDFSMMPCTRTAFDWWLWIQAWLHGTANVSTATTLSYRQHTGQEQRNYGAQAFRNDAARMLLSVIESPAFTECIEAWTSVQLEQFAVTLLLSDGPNSGDSRWGPLVQMALSDRLLGRVSKDISCSLFAQACGQAGTPASIGALKALDPHSQITALPKETWSRVPGEFLWASTCPAMEAWKAFLNVQEGELVPQFAIEATCSCMHSPSCRHELTFLGKRFSDGETTRFVTCCPPTETEVARLLDDFGRLTGRLHGFEIHVDGEARILRMYRSFRLTRIGVLFEKAYRVRGRTKQTLRGVRAPKEI